MIKSKECKSKEHKPDTTLVNLNKIVIDTNGSLQITTWTIQGLYLGRIHFC